MKKLLLLTTIFISCIALISCHSKHINLEDLYGKYVYKECIYYEYYTSNMNEQNQLYHNNVRFSFQETKYQYYIVSTEPLIDMVNIKYIEKKLDEYITTNKEIKKVLKKIITRYDIYKNDNNQGYSLLAGENCTYFMEYYRKEINDENYTVKQIVLIDK